MRVLIVAVGSRGDVAPFTGLGTALQAAGHRVTIAGYELSAGLVQGAGLAFRALPGDPAIMAAARWQRGATGPAGTARLVRLIAGHLRELHAGMLAAARADADVLLLSGLTAIGGYHIAQGLGLPSAGLGLQPVSPTAAFPPSLVAARSLGRVGNRLAGQALIALGVPAIGGPVRELRAELGLPRLRTRAAIFGEQDARDWPGFHGYSPAVLPRPADWRPGLTVTGYWWPRRPDGWTPPADLEAFLSAGPPPVLVGFGSMAPADAGALSDMAVAAARQAGTRLLLQAGGAGLAAAGPPRADRLVIGDVPHDWLFPRLAAVVHHAGAGTTGAALRAGIPAVTMPMVGDQPFWAARVAALGAGPAPLSRRRRSVATLADAIEAAVTDPVYRDRAGAVARALAAQDGTAPVVDFVSGVERTSHDGC
jgi:sterol 3beta-glucosyltransferase